MIDYKIVKYCRLCKKRFLVNKGEMKINFCTDCQKRFAKEQKEREENENKD